ncbi:MAG: IS3 family transposase [Burkholderiaceae bacterium]|nr:IS3 family transposase [Burkholderiaceae bacterium]
MRYAWIVEHRASYAIATMCDVLSVSRSGLYGAMQRARATTKARDDARIIEEIRRAQRRHRGRYGRRRMTPEIREALGQAVNHKRIGRLMREHGLGSRKRRPFRVVTTDSRHAHPIASNVVQRDFTTTAPNQKWLADITYVRTDEGWLYLALVLDLFSRKIVGWAMSDSMPQELTIEALRVAIGGRDLSAGWHHSDRGSQYAAADYRKILRERDITVSMSRKGDCWDNALMESANGTFKVEACTASTSPRVSRRAWRSSSSSAITTPNAGTLLWGISRRYSSRGDGSKSSPHPLRPAH